jgi:uncharacterized protein YeeX (DUF496 family)
MFFKRKKVTMNKKQVVVSDEVAFYVHEGPTVRNLRELLEEMKEMSDEQYNFHTKKRGNDFANWVDHVLNEKTLADKLKHAPSKSAAIYALEKYFEDDDFEN